MISNTTVQTPLTMRRIFSIWWPLAMGWLLMTVEIPMLTAIIARVPEPQVNLAAWGIAFVVTLIIGSPAVMFLAVSTALSKDWSSYITLRRYLIGVLALLTGVHALFALTSLYDLVVVKLIGVPPAIVEPARLGLIIMLPWTIGVGYRRFNYGVLIRFGQPRAVTVGVTTRLATDAVVLALFYLFGSASGVVIATATFTLGIVAEAIYSQLRVQPVLQNQLKDAPPLAEPLTLRLFLNFFIPLVLTSILQMLVQPIVSAGLSRMPNPLESLAVWPVIFGLLILFTSPGMAYTEVVVVLLDEPGALSQLRRFMVWLGIISTALLLAMSATPLTTGWFTYVAALPPPLVLLAVWGIWLLLPMPYFRVLESWYQGILINKKRTRGISESVIIFLLASSAVLWTGVMWEAIVGLYIGLAATVIGDLARTFWLWYRARPTLKATNIHEGDLLLQPNP